jgi:hypothetical protein
MLWKCCQELSQNESIGETVSTQCPPQTQGHLCRGLELGVLRPEPGIPNQWCRSKHDLL